MAFFLVLGTVLWLRLRREKAGWKKVAETLCMTYLEEAGRRLEPALRRFDLFRGGTVHQATQVLSGHFRGHEVDAFNWFFRSGRELNAVRGGFACLLVQLPAKLPALRLNPRDYGTYLSSLSGDTMVLSDDPLWQRYRLHARDRRFAESFFNQEVCAFIEAEGGLLIALEGDQLLMAREGEWNPVNIRDGLARWVTLADHVPIDSRGA
jgi:hypothetical protein